MHPCPLTAAPINVRATNRLQPSTSFRKALLGQTATWFASTTCYKSNIPSPVTRKHPWRENHQVLCENTTTTIQPNIVLIAHEYALRNVETKRLSCPARPPRDLLRLWSPEKWRFPRGIHLIFAWFWVNYSQLENADFSASILFFLACCDEFWWILAIFILFILSFLFRCALADHMISSAPLTPQRWMIGYILDPALSPWWHLPSYFLISTLPSSSSLLLWLLLG